MTGTCPPCAKDDHAHHTGYYDVKIQRKGHPLPGRKVECGCPACVRRVSTVVSLPVATREFTLDPCGKCSHPSHWKFSLDGETYFATPNGIVCYNCPRCGEVRA